MFSLRCWKLCGTAGIQQVITFVRRLNFSLQGNDTEKFPVYFTVNVKELRVSNNFVTAARRLSSSFQGSLTIIKFQFNAPSFV